MVGRGARTSGAAQILFTCLVVVLAGPARSSDPPPEWTCRQEICERISRRGASLTIELRSERAGPTWVVLEPEEMANVKALQAIPFIVRLEPREEKTAGRLAIQDPDAPHSYRTKWRTLSGNPRAIHDDRWHYRMPFGGSRHVQISQGYDGKFSHKGASAHALDFPMPWGTPILAARGGTIVEVVNDKVASGVRSGESDGDNRVVIEHADGTLAAYAHLRHGGPARVGRRVMSGELIGFSGDTGFATGPHLHFEIYKIRMNGQRETIPVRFWNGTPAGFTALAGLQYKPGCRRGGGGVCLPGELATESTSRSRSESESVPAAPDPAGKTAPVSMPHRREDGACVCPNRAILYVDPPCELVCGR